MMFNPIHRSSPTRIMGLSSGFDTDNLIQQMMRVHQMRIDNKMRSRTVLQWRQETHNSLRDQVNMFRNTFLRSTGATGMLNRTMYNSVFANVMAGGRASNLASVSVTQNAPVGLIKILEATKATGASVSSANRINATMNTRVSTLGLTEPITIKNDTVGNINFNLSGSYNSITDGIDNYTLSTDNLNSIISQFRSAYGPDSVSIDEADSSIRILTIPGGEGGTDKTIRLTSDMTIGALTAAFKGDPLSASAANLDVKVNYNTGRVEMNLPGVPREPITIAADDTIDSIIAKLKSAGLFESEEGDIVKVTLPGGSEFEIDKSIHTNGAEVLELFNITPGTDGKGVIDLPETPRSMSFALSGTVANMLSAIRAAGGTVSEDGKKVTFEDPDTGVVTEIDDVDFTKSLGDILSGTTPPPLGAIDYQKGTVSLTLGDKDITFNLGGVIGNMINQINNAGGTIYANGSVGLRISEVDPETKLPTSDSPGDITFNLGDNIGKILSDITAFGWLSGVTVDDGSVNIRNLATKEETFTPGENMTVRQLIDKVNGLGIGVKMSFDELAQRFSLESTVTGNGFKLDIKGLEKLGLGDGVYPIPPAPGVAPPTHGTAKLLINGIEETVHFSDNVIVLAGGAVRITINDDIKPGDEVEIEIKRDSTQAVNNIKSAVDSFNAILKRIDDMLKDRKGVNERGYTALTDEEKAVMSEKQIEEWEAIAKKGIMRGDPGLQSVLNRLRDDIINGVRTVQEKTGHHFMSLSGGQIVINEDRLKAALEDRPEDVADFFAKIENGKGTGLFYDMEKRLSDFVNTSQIRTRQNLENSIREVNLQMERMTLKMYAEEDKLYRQFAAMETALSKLQQQGDWMTSMLGGQQ